MIINYDVNLRFLDDLFKYFIFVKPPHIHTRSVDIFSSNGNKRLKSKEENIGRNDILFYNYNRAFPSSEQQHSWVLNEDSKWIYCPVHSLLGKRMSVDVCLLSYILGARSNLWPETCLFYERTYIYSPQVASCNVCTYCCATRIRYFLRSRNDNFICNRYIKMHQNLRNIYHTVIYH